MPIDYEILVLPMWKPESVKPYKMYSHDPAVLVHPWAQFLYRHAPGWIMRAILNDPAGPEDAETIETLRNRLRELEKETAR